MDEEQDTTNYSAKSSDLTTAQELEGSSDSAKHSDLSVLGKCLQIPTLPAYLTSTGTSGSSMDHRENRTSTNMRGKKSICYNFKFSNPGEIVSVNDASDTCSVVSQTAQLPIQKWDEALNFLNFCLNSEWDEAYECLPAISEIAEYPFMLDKVRDEKALITPLMMAAKDGEVKIVSNLLNWGVNPDAIDVEGNAAIHYTVSTGSINCLKVLLDYLARRDILGGIQKSSPIHIAATIKEEDLAEEILDLLLKDQSDLYITDADGWIPLFYAINSRNYKVVQYLLQKEPKDQLSFCDEKNHFTALHVVSTMDDNLEMMKVILACLDNEEDICTLVNQKNKKGKTPLHLCARNGNRDVIEFLRERGAKASIVDRKDKTSLQYAIENGHFDLYDILVSSDRMEILNRDKQGNTLLHLSATYHLETKAIRNFINLGVNHLMPNKNGETCMHAAAASGNSKILSMLFTMKIDINQYNKKNYTPLHIAVMNLRENIVELLLGAGADVNAKGGDIEETPLLIASSNPQGFKCAQSLICCGAEVTTVNTNDDSALHLAASVGNVDLMVIIINESGVLNMKNRDGNTPLHLAVRYCHKQAVVCLLEHIKRSKGLSEAVEHVNMRNNNGETPLHFAAGLSKDIQHYINENIEIINALMKYSADYSIENLINKETPFHYCARGGDCKILKEIFNFLKSQGNFYQVVRSSINCKALNGWTPMHCASYFNHPNIVQLLLKIDCRIDLFDNEGFTPVHLAAKEGHSTIVDILMKKTAFVDTRTTLGYTPLHLAAKYGHQDCVVLLIKFYKAKIDVFSLSGSTPLHLAAENGKHKICKALLTHKDKPAKPHVLDKKKRTPLHMAAFNNHRNVFKCFNTHAKRTILEVHFDINGRTYAHYAAMRGSTEFLREVMRVNQKMVIYQKDRRSNNTALHYAAEGGHLAIVQQILTLNQNASEENNEGNTPIHLAAFKGHSQIVNALKMYSRINVCSDVHGLSPLHSAALTGQLQALQQIVEAGVDYNMKTEKSETKMLDDDYGYTALHFASFHGHEEVVRYLLQLIDIEMKAMTIERGSLSIHLAAANGHLSIISLCLSIDSTLIEVQDKAGLTVLHFASAFGHLPLVSVLISQGSDINKKEKQEYTPLHYAAHAGHLSVVKLLVESGANVKAVSRASQLPISLAAEALHANVVRYLLEQDKDRDVLLEDFKFLYHLMECSKLDENKSLDNFILESENPTFVAARLSKRYKTMEKNKKVRSADFKNAKLYCQELGSELLCRAASKIDISILLYSVNEHEETFMDVMLNNKQKLVLAHPVIQQFITTMWYCGPHKIKNPNATLQLWQKCDIPLVKFILYFLSHIILIVLLFSTQYPNIYMQENLMIDRHNWLLHIWLFGYVFAEYVNRLVMSYLRILNLMIALSGVFLHYFSLFIYNDDSKTWIRFRDVLYIRNQIFAVANFLFILTTLEFLKFHYFFGPWSMILKSLFRELIRFSLFMVIFVLCFWWVFTSIHQPVRKPDSIYESTITTWYLLKVLYFSIFGLIDYNSLPQPEYSPKWGAFVSHILMSIYMMFTSVVLFNLLITRLCDLYQEITDNADIEWKFGRVSMIWKLSRISLMPGPIILITQFVFNLQELHRRIKNPGKTEILAKTWDVVDWRRIIEKMKLQECNGVSRVDTP